MAIKILNGVDVIGDMNITAADVPNLSASKITSGTFATSHIPSLDAGKITSGVFSSARIPSLDASKITSGTFNAARIPDLSATYQTAGSYLTTSGKAADSNLLDGINSTGFVRYDGRLSANADTVSYTSVKVWDVSTASDAPGGAVDGLLTTKYWDSLSWAVQSYHDFHTNRLYLRGKQSGTWQAEWSEVWTTDNFNPASYLTTGGKAADSNLLDGINSTSFLRSDTSDSFSGQLTNASINETPAYNRGAINLQPSVSGGATGITFRSRVNSTSDAGYIWWYDDNDHYNEFNSSENGVLLIAAQNDGGATSEDAIAIESSGDIYLNPGVASGAIGSGQFNSARGNIYLGYAASRSKILTTSDEGAGNGLDADTVDGLQASSFIRSDAADSVSGQITFNAGITGFDSASSISGNNFEITGVNAITINDPGEGIIWSNGANGNIILATIDDASDNILNLTGTGASFAVNGAKVATESFVTSRGYITDGNTNWNNTYGFITASDNITGNAATATKLATARNIALAGDVTGSANFDGSGNISITTAVANDSHTHDGRYYTESEADSRFVNVTGDTVTGNLSVDGASLSVTSDTADSDAFFVDGVNGRLFTVTDSLDDSLFSVNTISGLPVIEAFADNTVKLGPFTNPVEITSTGQLNVNSNVVVSQDLIVNEVNQSNANFVISAINTGSVTSTSQEVQGSTHTATNYWRFYSGEGLTLEISPSDLIAYVGSENVEAFIGEQFTMTGTISGEVGDEIVDMTCTVFSYGYFNEGLGTYAFYFEVDSYGNGDQVTYASSDDQTVTLNLGVQTTLGVIQTNSAPYVNPNLDYVITTNATGPDNILENGEAIYVHSVETVSGSTVIKITDPNLLPQIGSLIYLHQSKAKLTVKDSAYNVEELISYDRVTGESSSILPSFISSTKNYFGYDDVIIDEYTKANWNSSIINNYSQGVYIATALSAQDGTGYVDGSVIVGGDIRVPTSSRYAVFMGTNLTGTGSLENSVTIGASNYATTSPESVIIGYSNTATSASGGVVIGTQAKILGTGSTAIGRYARAMDYGASCIGTPRIITYSFGVYNNPTFLYGYNTATLPKSSLSPFGSWYFGFPQTTNYNYVINMTNLNGGSTYFQHQASKIRVEGTFKNMTTGSPVALSRIYSMFFEDGQGWMPFRVRDEEVDDIFEIRIEPLDPYTLAVQLYNKTGNAYQIINADFLVEIIGGTRVV